VCSKPEKVTYDNGFQNFLSSNCKDGQNFELLKSLHPVHNQISSSHRQLPEFMAPESLVGLRCMVTVGNLRKFATMFVLKVS
jgi:hypothetical protein